MPKSVARSPEFLGVAPDVDAILARLAERHSCRDFDNQPIDIATIEEIVADGTNAPSSCNQQNWHFVVVTDPALRKQAREISGGNHHFEFCSAIIYLCFLKGWTHDKFSVVQSVAGACYHMMLSAHLRGFATIWNAGIGDPRSVARMLSIPPLFEIQGALCVGRPAATAPAVKAPRRSVKEIWSHNVFKRPAHATYLAKPAPHYPFFRIHNTDNPFAEWRPDKWGWDRIGDFRGYSVWAKSPLAGVYRSRRQGDATNAELDLLPNLAPGSRVVDLMPWGGTYTVELRRRFGPQVALHIGELSPHHYTFIAERLRQEGLSDANLHNDLIKGGRLPYADGSIDAVFAAQALEHTPEPERVLDEIARVLKPGGHAVITVRNRWSRYGWYYRRRLSREQVPNQGPFVPLSSFAVRRALLARFAIDQEQGISLQAETDATLFSGVSRFFCRLYAARVVKRA